MVMENLLTKARRKYLTDAFRFATLTQVKPGNPGWRRKEDQRGDTPPHQEVRGTGSTDAVQRDWGGRVNVMVFQTIPSDSIHNQEAKGGMKTT
jgi:hypothetical protein